MRARRRWRRSAPRRSPSSWASPRPREHSSSATPWTCGTGCPLLWKRVQKLSGAGLAGPPGRPADPRPPFEGARWVDDQLAARTDGGCGPVITDRLVAQVTATYDPEEHEKREDTRPGLLGHQDHPPQPDRLRRHQRPGHPRRHLDPDGVLRPARRHRPPAAPGRRHRPAGGPQDQSHRHHHHPGHRTDDRPGGARPAGGLRRGGEEAGRQVKAYLHVGAEDLDVDATGGAAFATGTIEKLGAATLAKLRTWVGHHQVVIQPVLNMARRDAVDSHDPPAWMRELVILRDGHCIFPRCQVDARRCDLDHQTPYLPPDEGGPPGQTHPDALACLCRRHHRAKTARVWRYTRTPEGHYLWHGPHGSTYLVTDTGTQRVG